MDMQPEDKSANRGQSPLRLIIMGGLGLLLVGLIFIAGLAFGLGIGALRQAAVPDENVSTQGGGSSDAVDADESSGFNLNPLLPGSEGGNDAPSNEVPEDVDNFDIFWEAWNQIEDRYYYDLPDEQDRVYGAIQGLTDSLDDPYTRFIDPERTQIEMEDMSGEFEGIGAYVEEAPQGGVFILSLFDGGPAEQAGVEAEDIVVAVDGEDITDLILDQAILLIRGPAGSDVTLTIFREGETELIDIIVTRGRIEIPTVEYELLEGTDIGYIALTRFDSSATDRLNEALSDLIDQGANSLVLDLRGNPGGFLDQAVSVADVFLPSGVVLIQRDVDGNQRDYEGRNGQLGEDIPMVVLINGGSASASEIFAAAMRDYERATLIGTTTFGKGSVQTLYSLSDGSQLRVTTANFYSPNDIEINEVGVEPDIEVEIPDDADPEADPQLDRAIEFLQTGQ
ncbi:MAG: S41 family peptidase [Chloroflexi bacterium]|nr:S41 family peptidase [Chloroflexota bacterium]